MAPDLSSISPSRTSNSASPLTQSQSHSHTHNGDATPPPPPRSPSVSLAAAASMNAAERSRRLSHTNGQGPGSPQAARVAERRRSQVAMNLNLNDPSIPGPGELATSDARHSPSYGATGHFTLHSSGDPHHSRAPSLGEIHQELEQEQEAQVNRLLAMIRQQQAQLNSMQQAQQQQQQGSGAVEDSTPTSERSISFPPMPPVPAPGLRSSSSVRRSSRRSSQTATSPALRPMPSFSHASSDLAGSSANSSTDLPSTTRERRTSRDEAAFYQAEATSLTRENQMLRNRIRELERQVHDLTAKHEHAPASHSNLVSAPVENESDIAPAASAETATSAAPASTQTGDVEMT